MLETPNPDTRCVRCGRLFESAYDPACPRCGYDDRGENEDEDENENENQMSEMGMILFDAAGVMLRERFDCHD